MRIGFVGTGTIAAAMVEGLLRLRPQPDIVVSPRSEAVSRDLAARHGNVRRAESNAEVVAAAQLVVLSMRPAQLETALAGIAFRPDQLVVSLVAGLTLADVQALAPGCRVDRLVPLPGIARGEGPLTVFPGLPEVVALFRPLGDLIVARSESELNMGGVSSFMSTYFELQNALIRSAIASGATPENARLYVTSLLAMLSTTARTIAPEQFETLVHEHQTKGGLNERTRQRLLDAGWFEAPDEAFKAIAKLSRQALD